MTKEIVISIMKAQKLKLFLRITQMTISYPTSVRGPPIGKTSRIGIINDCLCGSHRKKTSKLIKP